MCGAPGRPIAPSRGLRLYYLPLFIPIYFYFDLNGRHPSPGRREDAPLALAAVAARVGGRRVRAQVPDRLPVARDLHRAARGEPVAPRDRARGAPLVARRQGLGVASDPQA